MRNIEESRKEINRIDKEMSRLFEERMEVCRDIALYKKEHGLSIRDKEREEAVINANRGKMQDADIDSYFVQFVRNNIDLSCAYQSRIIEGMKVGYGGVEGAYAYIAAKKMFPECTLISFPDFAPAYKAVEDGELDAVVLPLENSYAGDVGTVMDLTFSGSLFINQVMDLDIVHNLLTVPGARIQDIKTVVSHPQALGQCDEFISAHGLETIPYANTAMAAKYVSELKDPTVAAIASADTAELYGLSIAQSHINTVRNNTTKFASFSRSQHKPRNLQKRADDSFILVFTVQNEAGALAQTLNIIGAHGFNMKNLRSRPMKDLMWNYFFYVEAEGNVNSENGRDMLQELSAICAKLKLVGTYYTNNN